MKRTHLSRRQSSALARRTAKRTRVANLVRHVSRGGIRF